MDILNIKDLAQEGNESYSMHTIFKEQPKDGAVQVGHVVIYPGETVPLSGFSKHAENEYSVIVKGSLLTEIDGQQYRVSAGQATFIPKGEEHIAVNDGEEDCELVFVMVG
ncbi:cupin domain-containing protein [Planococcus sp. APC 3900]|uniref:cupin domain-containing protein n=1 Tax=Planococcus sp. APC 3900 TaxID=3035191 RepID=UPI0025B458EE|nr:cupin domain-containing protein [Planococcus sp. APC 3900]MDN3438383.1 cupin domain-containing protein [Planococcus sp. APC 3900]